MTVELRVLGQVDVLVGGTPVELGHARQRCVLAALLVDANQVIATDQVVDRTWGERPPRRARQLVSNYLSRLRHLLADAGGGDAVIQRRGGGYALLVDPDRVDVHRFRGLVARSRAATDEAHALELLERAAAQWRGEALAGLDTPWTTSVREGLARERFAADTQRLDLALRLRRHAASLPELTDRAAAHPLDEHVAAQLMLALYRSGRQADALDHYRRLRARLAEELGTDLGPDLHRLHQRILTADPALAAPAATTGRTPASPRQLPAAPAPFTGRVVELAELDHALTAATQNGNGTPVMISAIGGVGGIGKTWLALTWAHRHLDRFPDGQLFVDLRGFSPIAAPADPADALRGFLTSLGDDPGGLPPEVDALAARYRALVAGRRMLVVLDNAASAEQVVPLLPGGAAGTVLVTSRRTLSSLIDRHGARHLPLDVLSRAEARALLIARLGEQRVAAEPGVTDDLVELCGRHPLALVIIARHAATRPALPLAEFAAELREVGLEALDHDTDPTASLPTVLSWSLRHLTDRQREVFAFLGIAPGPDIDLVAAASLTGLSPVDVHKVLRVLEDASLLDRRPRRRYAMHDLVRAYAATLADLSEPTHRAALERLVDFYLHTAHTADQVLDPQRSDIRLDPPAPGCQPQPLPDRAAAMTWLTTHHRHLLAAQHTAAVLHRYEAVWQLAWTMHTFHLRRGHRHDNLAAWQAALDAAENLPDPAVRLRAHRLAGNAHAALGQHAQAIDHLHQALGLAERLPDRTHHAHTHNALSIAWMQFGDDRRALEHAHRALDLFRGLDLPLWVAYSLNGVGWVTARVGDHDTARHHCQAALDLFDRHPDPEGEAATHDSLGWIEHSAGNHHQAVRHYQQAVALLRTIGNASEAASTLDRLGDPHAALGHHNEARAAWREAVELYRQQGLDRDAERVQRQLDELDRTVTSPAP